MIFNTSISFQLDCIANLANIISGSSGGPPNCDPPSTRPRVALTLSPDQQVIILPWIHTNKCGNRTNSHFISAQLCHFGNKKCQKLCYWSLAQSLVHIFCLVLHQTHSLQLPSLKTRDSFFLWFILDLCADCFFACLCLFIWFYKFRHTVGVLHDTVAQCLLCIWKC